MNTRPPRRPCSPSLAAAAPLTSKGTMASAYHAFHDAGPLTSPLLGKEATDDIEHNPETSLLLTKAAEKLATQTTCSLHSDPEDDDAYSYSKGPRRRMCCCCCPLWLKSLFVLLLALGGIATSIWAILNTSTSGTALVYAIWVYISCGICLFASLAVLKNERTIGISVWRNASREEVLELMEGRRRLEHEYGRLTDEVETLERAVARGESARVKLGRLVGGSNDVEEAIALVRENERTLDGIREHLRQKALQDVVEVIIQDQSALAEGIDDVKAQSLASKIEDKLARRRIVLNRDRLLHALATDATLRGALKTVKRLLPKDEPLGYASQVGEEDVYDMYSLSIDDARQQGSLHAARARIARAPAVSLSPTPQRLKRHTGPSPDAPTAADADDEEELPREYRNRAREQCHQFWIMAAPYFRETTRGKVLMGTLIVLSFVSSAIGVYFSYLFRDWSTALAEKHAEEFYRIVAKFLLSMIVLIPLQVSFRFVRVKLAIDWRKWLTERTLKLYFSNKVYYGLERQSKAAGSSARSYSDRRKDMDNPDQRIEQDVAAFTGESLNFLLTVLNTILNLITYSAILFSIMPELFIAIILFASVGTVFSVLIGKVLIKLNYESLQRSADFRFSLVRVRENAESIAFYTGEDVEQREVRRKLHRVIDNSNAMNLAELRLDLFTTTYHHLVNILPTFILAHQYFIGAIEFGVIAQTGGAFGQVLSDLSIIINQFNGIASFMAGIDRLFLFMKAIQELDQDRDNDDRTVAIVQRRDPHAALMPAEGAIVMKEETEIAPRVSQSQRPILEMRNLRLDTPDHKRCLIDQLNLTLAKGKNLLISGVSGAGKSSLLRAIAGLWLAGDGEIVRAKDVYFLPQKPYCPPGTLRDQLLYPRSEIRDADDDSSDPTDTADLSDEELLAILDAVDLPDLASRSGDGDPIAGIRRTLDWSNTLSLGEQQRLAFGRLLVNRPRLVMMDESTSALDVVAERRMYALLRERLISEDTGEPATYVSVGHRPTLLEYHDIKLLVRDGEGSASFIPREDAGADPESMLRSLHR